MEYARYSSRLQLQAVIENRIHSEADHRYNYYYNEKPKNLQLVTCSMILHNNGVYAPLKTYDMSIGVRRFTSSADLGICNFYKQWMREDNKETIGSKKTLIYNFESLNCENPQIV